LPTVYFAVLLCATDIPHSRHPALTINIPVYYYSLQTWS